MYVYFFRFSLICLFVLCEMQRLYNYISGKQRYFTTELIVSITICLILIGSTRVYVLCYWSTIPWVSNYSCPILTFCNWIAVIGHLRCAQVENIAQYAQEQLKRTILKVHFGANIKLTFSRDSLQYGGVGIQLFPGEVV